MKTIAGFILGNQNKQCLDPDRRKGDNHLNMVHEKSEVTCTSLDGKYSNVVVLQKFPPFPTWTFRPIAKAHPRQGYSEKEIVYFQFEYDLSDGT